MRANILCAGLGERFQPFSLIKPKSFIKIGGMPLIERTIVQLREHGVSDIALVTGYKHEQFAYLTEKYGVELYVSTEYTRKNNFSSVALIKHRLEDALLIDSDLYLQRAIVPLIVPGKSQFLSQRIDQGSEWALDTDADGRIVQVRKHVSSGYVMTGVSYWTGEAAKLLAKELDTCSDTDFWEDAAIRILDKTPIYLTKAPTYATEIDSLHEAINAKLLTSDEIAMQCSDGVLAERLKGLTNNTYKIVLRNQEMVLRIPGEGTEKIINREHEAFITSLLEGHNISPTCTYFPGGIKIMPFLKNYRILEQESLNIEEVVAVAKKLRALHAIDIKGKVSPAPPISMLGEAKLYEGLTGVSFLEKHEQELMYAWAQRLDADPQVLCHRDLLLENILTNGKDIQLIDFEYACFTSPYWDIVSFITESRIEGNLRKSYLEAYGDLDMQRVLQAEILVDYIWSLWGFYQKYYTYARGRMAMFDKNLKAYAEKYSLNA